VFFVRLQFSSATNANIFFKGLQLNFLKIFLRAIDSNLLKNLIISQILRSQTLKIDHLHFN
jgi:hypothetical protein